MASEIVDDLSVTTIEINDESGINLSGYNSRIKHSGEGVFTLTSTSSLDEAISIYLPNGGLDVNAHKTIDFKASDESSEAITLQAYQGGIGITASNLINITSSEDSIILEAPSGEIQLLSSDDISLLSDSSVVLESGLAECGAINIVAPLGGMNVYAQNIFMSSGSNPFFPLNKEKTDLSEQMKQIINKSKPISKSQIEERVQNIKNHVESELTPRALLCPVGYYSQFSDYLMTIGTNRENTEIFNGVPGLALIGVDSAILIESFKSNNGVSGLPPGHDGFINTNIGLFTDGDILISSDGANGISGILIGTEYSVPINIGTTENLTTVKGDLTVDGSLIVNGPTVQHNVTVFDSEDPLFYLNKGITATNTRDIGFIGERGNQQNVGWFWNEASDEFVAVGIVAHGDQTNNLITPIDNYKPIHCGGLVVETDTSNVTPTVCNVSVNGQISLTTTSNTSDSISVTTSGGMTTNAVGKVSLTTTSNASDSISIITSGGMTTSATGKVSLTTTSNASDSISVTTSGAITTSTVNGISMTNTGNTTALSVNQQGSADIVNFKDNDSSALIVKDGGTVGINTSSPSSTYKLDVNGKSNVSDGVYQAGFLLVPPGAIMPYAASTAPGGWLICDGSAVSRTTYSALFALVGSQYGNGDGVNTFNLPNMKGRMIVGYNSTDANFDSLGEAGGSKTATLTTNELPAHTHTGTTDSSGSHNHIYNDAYFAEVGGSGPGNIFGSASTDEDNNFRWRTAAGGYSSSPQDLNTSTNGSHSHTFTTASTGSGNAFAIMNPYITLNYIIKY